MMNELSENTQLAISLPARQQINAICDKFDQAWQAAITRGDSPPYPAHYLVPLDEPDALAYLLRELLYVDVDYGLGLTTPFSLAEFKLRWPQPELIDELEHVIAQRQQSWQIGELVAQRYRIVQLLGRGGMGEVFLAADRELGEQVALKRLRVGSWEVLRREVGLARKVTHEHVCRVFDLGPPEQLPFFSMEYIAGQTLDKLLKSTGALKETRAKRIAEQICLGLQAAHDKQVVHRDLKPGNVLIDEHGDVHLTDFGLACPIDDEHAIPGGTLIYMSPEQLSGGKVTAASDLYSLGLLVFELYTGRRLYQKTTVEEALAERQAFQLIEQREYFDLPTSVRETIAACLALRPEDRPASAKHVRQMLLDDLGSIADRVSKRTWNPSMAIGALSIVVLGLSAILFLADSITLIGQAEPKDPQSLHNAADKVWQRLNLPQPRDRAAGYVANSSHAAIPSEMICYVQRQSPGLLIPNQFFPLDYLSWQTFVVGLVSLNNPAPLVPGEGYVLLDGKGGLLQLHILPLNDSPTTTDLFALEIWTDVLPEDCPKCSWQRVDSPKIDLAPTFAYDEIQQWTSGDGSAAWQLTVAHHQGQLVYLDCASPVIRTHRDGIGQPQASRISIGTGLYLTLTIVAAVGALRNIWLGYCDHRSATKVAVAVWLLAMVGHSLVAHHQATMNELDILEICLAMSLYLGFIAWLAYVAYEPYVRRYLPDAFISWGRLLSGRLNDWLIGRDLLIGIALAVFSMAATELVLWLLDPARHLFEGMTNGLLNARAFVGLVCIWWSFCTALSLLMLVSLVLVRRVLPRRAARIACILVWTVPFMTPFASNDWLSVGISVCLTTLTVIVLEKYGFLPIVVSWLARILLLAPLTADMNRWHSGLSTAVILVLVVAAAYGAWSSLRVRGDGDLANA